MHEYELITYPSVQQTVPSLVFFFIWEPFDGHVTVGELIFVVGYSLLSYGRDR